jgi:hypothetical protein
MNIWCFHDSSVYGSYLVIVKVLSKSTEAPLSCELTAGVFRVVKCMQIEARTVVQDACVEWHVSFYVRVGVLYFVGVDVANAYFIVIDTVARVTHDASYPHIMIWTAHIQRDV